MDLTVLEESVKKLVSVLLGAIVVLVLLSLVWRLASRRRSIPCPSWLRWLVELDNPLARTNRVNEIVGHLDLALGMRVLDIGCGPGRVTIPVARQVGPAGEVVAVDIQPEMLHRVEVKARDAGLVNVRLVQAAAGTGALDVERADRALLVTVLGEIPDREAAMRQIFDALVPGGILSVTEIVFDPHFQSRATVTRLAAEAGFREAAFFGNRFAYTLNLFKPGSVKQRFRADGVGASLK
jgi:SAM-dependent methyltransferase